jgi:hypothetical protein
MWRPARSAICIQLFFVAHGCSVRQKLNLISGACTVLRAKKKERAPENGVDLGAAPLPRTHSQAECNKENAGWLVSGRSVQQDGTARRATLYHPMCAPGVSRAGRAQATDSCHPQSCGRSDPAPTLHVLAVLLHAGPASMQPWCCCITQNAARRSCRVQRVTQRQQGKDGCDLACISVISSACSLPTV